MEIKTETEDSINESNKTCNLTENKEEIYSEQNYDRDVKCEISETYDFKPSTEYQIGEINDDTEIHRVFIKVEDKIDYYVKHEINEEFIIKEEDKQDDFSGKHTVEQQKSFCSQNVPGNSAANKNDFNAAVSTLTQNQEPIHHKEIIKCQKSRETYSNKKDRHTKNLHICDVCQKSFTTTNNLKIHKLLHTGKQSHVCDICQKVFSRLDYLKTHKLTHSDDRPHACDVCQKSFSTSTHLKNHKVVHTEKKPHVCDICQKAFNRIDVLRRHKLTHTDEQPYKCDACRKTFNRIDTLRNHNKFTHSDEQPYKCDDCQKTFSQRCHLKSHKIVHTGEKSHVCDVCQKKFGQPQHLRRHKLIHSGEKPHKCDVCQKNFSQKEHLRKHKRITCGSVITQSENV